MFFRFCFAVVFLCLFISLEAAADTLIVAVASNFTGTLQKLADRFKETRGHEVLISSASTGKIYAQIKNGAPFDIFMSADEIHVDKLVREGQIEANPTAIYAIGKLVFISNIAPVNSQVNSQPGKCQDVLAAATLGHVAIANPQSAPYGAAAQQVMQHLGVWDKLQSKLVMGENIAQTLQFVASTSADAGFVAKAGLMGDTVVARACEWAVPADLHTPLSQKMGVLKSAKNKPAVRAFWQFMQSAEATIIIRNGGYDVPAPLKNKTPLKSKAGS